jgi:outer membrane protein
MIIRFGFLFVLCFVALVRTAGAIDIISIYELALANDATFGADAAEYRAEQQAPTTARSLLLPALSAGAGLGRVRDERTGGNDFTAGGDVVTDGSATYGSTDYYIQFRQSIYDRRKILTYRQSKTRAAESDVDFAIARQDLIIRTVDRYFAVLAARDNIDLTVANRKALQRQLELAEERLQVGLGTTTDLFEAQARFSLAEAEEIEAYNLFENARQSLAELIGQVPPGTLVRLKPDAPLISPEPNDIDTWVQRAIANNLELTASKRSEEIALQEIEREKAGHLPVLDFVVNHNVIDDDGSISGPAFRTEGTDAMVQLTLPILEGGVVVSRTKEAGFRYQAAQERTESARRSAEQIARSAFLNTITRIRQVEALDKAVLASESAVEAKQEGFDAGLNTNIDVLDAQRDLFRAQRDHLRSRYDYILNRLALEAVVGDLRRDDIVQVNSWLQ